MKTFRFPDRRLLGGLAVATSLALSAAAGPANVGAGEPPAAPDLRLNELQYIGTHNSYHVQPDPRILGYMRRTRYQASAAWPADKLAPALSYTHPPLRQQLELGLRNLEIDVFYDPTGGRFSRPGAIETIARADGARLEGPPPEVMAAPGFKVMHMADIDFHANCWTLAACLKEVRDWSDAHPGHAPLILMIEAKEGAAPPLSPDYRPAAALPFEPEAWRALEAEILSVFPRERLITPDEVRGGAPTLRQGIARHGWPRVEAARGRVLLTLNAKPPALKRYFAVHPGGHGGLFFFDDGLDDPETAWVFRNNPFAADLPALVRAGYLVYTRADADGVEPRRGDSGRRDQAFRAAQVISTDYPVPDPAVGRYQAAFPDGAYVRPDPLLRPDLRGAPGG